VTHHTLAWNQAHHGVRIQRKAPLRVPDILRDIAMVDGETEQYSTLALGGLIPRGAHRKTVYHVVMIALDTSYK
jgi:hypothetical protein